MQTLVPVVICSTSSLSCRKERWINYNRCVFRVTEDENEDDDDDENEDDDYDTFILRRSSFSVKRKTQGSSW